MFWCDTFLTVFQFPSNGKVDSKYRRLGRISRCGSTCFNSLQTGKWIQRFYFIACTCRQDRFQFPSNGKVDSKATNEFGRCYQTHYCFNSLQTGKWIQRITPNDSQCEDYVSIPFKRESGFKDQPRKTPSNWKVQGFNSLQTGKWIQRGKQSATHTRQRCQGFNSLQTGKWIQRPS